MIELRDYQREAVAALEGSDLQRPAFVLPTGAGKTIVFAEYVRRHLQRWRAAGESGRVLVLAHRDELISQAAGKLADALGLLDAPLRVGVVKAHRNETLADVVVGSVQTLVRSSRRRQLRLVRRIVVDEAHHAAAPSYLTILRELGAFEQDSGVRAIGCTATMVRGDGKALGEVWQDIVFERSTAWMIQHDPPFLVRPRGLRVRVQDLDLSSVRRSRGDYSEGDLGRALEGSLAPEAVVKAVAEHAHDRRGILFAPTVRATQLFAEALKNAGYTVATIFGDTASEERSAALADFRAGTVQFLCNCMVLTEGTDLPMCDLIVIARPTTNNGLYVQMVGRGLRLWPGKSDCLVLDVVGASARNTLRTQIHLDGEVSAFDALAGESVDRDEEDVLDDDELTLDVAGEAFGAQPDDPSWLNGPLTAEIVDLFHGSASAWQRTARGVWFLPAGERYIVIVRAPAERGRGYDVFWCDQYRRGVSQWVVTGVTDLSYAMAYAEANVTVSEQAIARKDRRWRSGKPSEKQIAYGRRFGIEPGVMTSGEHSAAITYHAASRRIDPYLQPWMVG